MTPKSPLTIEQALQIGLRHLTRKMHTVHEIREVLKRKGFPEDIMEEAVALLSRDGYLNDLTYMEAYIEEKRRTSPRGYFALRYELKLRGIPSSLLEELRALYPLEAEIEDVVRLLSLWQRKGEEKGKLWRRLRTRGFSEEAVERGWSSFFERPCP